MGIWNEVKKFDAHVHIIPNEKREEIIRNYGKNDAWASSDIDTLLEHMDKHNIEKALLLPINDGRLFYEMRKTNEFIADLVQKSSNRFVGFADLQIIDVYGMHEAAYELEYAVKELGLKGLKIHPSNLNIDADDLRLVPVLRKAAELKIPVMYHSNPWGPGFYDVSSPHKINRMIKIFPDINFIAAHMGGQRHMDAIKAVGMVDISYTLPELVDIYGIEITNNILKKFGADRLIFGTDFPEGNYEKYFDILNSMDFNKEEVEKIAYKNIEKLLITK